MNKQGFSLVELSIVLVILGLLTGGILGGQSLIKAAELRAVTTELDQWKTATNTFREKYMALPGDFNKAGQFWGYANTGGAGGVCAAPATNTGASPLTCDGDGDGILDTDNETFRYWQHLSNAGLITGVYTGVADGGGTTDSTIGENVPAGKYSGSGWGTRWLGDNAGMEGVLFAANYGHLFLFGAPMAGQQTHTPLLTPEEAWNIDTKIDDGMPAKGTVIAYQWDDCTNAANKDDDDAEYELSGSGVTCAMNFVRVF